MNNTILNRPLKVAGGLLCSTLVVLPLLYLLLVSFRTSVDVPRWHDWDFIRLLEKSYQGTLTIEDLLAHEIYWRTPLPRLVILGLARATNWNSNYIIAVNILLGALIFSVIAAKVISSGGRLDLSHNAWLLPVISVMVFSLSQWENWFWGWQVAVFINVFAVLVGFSVLSRNKLSCFGFAGAVLAGIVATYSYINGLLFWPIGLFLIMSLSRKKWHKLSASFVWILISLVIFYLYLNYPDPWNIGGRISGRPSNALFIFQYLAMPLIRSHRSWVALFGVLGGLWLVSVTGLLKFYLRVPWNKIAFWLAIALFSIGSAAMTTMGRYNPAESRYITFSSQFWVAVAALTFLLLRELDPRRHRKRAVIIAIRLNLAVMLIAMTALVAVNSRNNARSWYGISDRLREARERIRSAGTFVETQNLDPMIGPLEPGPMPRPRDLHILKKRQLSVYRQR